jgi:hypothetical protein
MWLSSHDAQLLDSEDATLIGFLIQWHMMPYFIVPKGEVCTKARFDEWGTKHRFSQENIDQIWAIHQADQEAH